LACTSGSEDLIVARFHVIDTVTLGSQKLAVLAGFIPERNSLPWSVKPVT